MADLGLRVAQRRSRAGAAAGRRRLPAAGGVRPQGCAAAAVLSGCPAPIPPPVRRSRPVRHHDQGRALRHRPGLSAGVRRRRRSPRPLRAALALAAGGGHPGRRGVRRPGGPSPQDPARLSGGHLGGDAADRRGPGQRRRTRRQFFYLVHSTWIAGALFLLADLIDQQRGAQGDTLGSGPPLAHPRLLGGLFFLGAISVAGCHPSPAFLAR